MEALHDRLARAGLLPTRQRLALAGLLFRNGDRHLTADELYTEARAAGLRVSRATVYNTLHAFVNGGLLREIPIEPDRSYFDTNPAHACHVYFDESQELIDLQLGRGDLKRLARNLGGVEPASVSVVVHVRGAVPRRLARRLRAGNRCRSSVGERARAHKARRPDRRASASGLHELPAVRVKRSFRRHT